LDDLTIRKKYPKERDHLESNGYSVRVDIALSEGTGIVDN